jgi:outer membrane protein OmpA-like peptidoglycan-associated protein
MSKAKQQNLIKLQAKRNVELWIYSFADMYMILSVFFIALSVLYAAKVKNQMDETVASAGRGPLAVESTLAIDFEKGSSELAALDKENLMLLIPVLKSVGSGSIDVEGYADSEALKKDSQFTSNLDLSNRRAVKVAEFLINNGVNSHRIRTFSYGNGKTFKINGKTLKTNRRVLIKVAASNGGQ